MLSARSSIELRWRYAVASRRRWALSVRRVARVTIAVTGLSIVSGAASIAAPEQAAGTKSPPVDHCVKHVVPIEGPNGYRNLGDRCEGEYVQPMSFAPPDIVGVQCRTASFEGKVTLRWAAPSAGLVQIHATSLDDKTFYRMDHRHETGPPTLLWPGNNRAAVGLTSSQIAVLATIDDKTDASKRVYLPVNTADTMPCDDVDLVLFSPLPFTKLEFGMTERHDTSPKIIRPLGALGSAGREPAHPAIRVPLPRVPSGFYDLQFLAYRPDADRPGRLATTTLVATIFLPGS